MLIREKIAQAIEILKEVHVDCWITFTRETQINGDPTLPFLAPADLTWQSAFIICADGETHAVVGLYDKPALDDIAAYTEVVGYVESIKKPLQEFLLKKNPASIAINYSTGSETCDGLTHGMYILLCGYLTEIGFSDRMISAERVISTLRQRKTHAELASIHEAIHHTERIFKSVTHFIMVGKTEEEIARFIRNEVEQRRLGYAWDTSTCPSVFSGPESVGAHYNPTRRKVEPGHVLNIDFGVMVNGYCADLQRTFYILRGDEDDPPAEVRRGFDTIVESIEKARLALKPGVTGVEVDKVAREVIASKGYNDFPHALGHQVGRYAHDGTALLGPPWEKYARRPHEKIEEGMVFTLEPRLTIEGYGIATVENMVLVTAKGAEFISTPQTKLILIG